MATFKNPESYRKAMLTRARNLQRIDQRVNYNVALQTSAFIKAIAPIKTGALASQIRPFRRGKVVGVESRQPVGSDRPYHMWWHNIGKYPLSTIASKQGWNLTGQAGIMGFQKNMYMKAGAKYAQLKLAEQTRIAVQQILKMNR